MCKKHARLVTKQVLLFIVGETLEFCTFITLLEIMNELEIFLNFDGEKIKKLWIIWSRSKDWKKRHSTGETQFSAHATP